MRPNYGSPSDRKLDALVRGASKFSGPWPTIPVWHGDSDTSVDNSNASAIVRQWQKIEGPATRIEMVDVFPREVWCDPDARVVIEHYIIADMGQGTLISAGGDEAWVKKASTCRRLAFPPPATSRISGV